jgi:hypothetical protein
VTCARGVAWRRGTYSAACVETCMRQCRAGRGATRAR